MAANSPAAGTCIDCGQMGTRAQKWPLVYPRAMGDLQQKLESHNSGRYTPVIGALDVLWILYAVKLVMMLSRSVNNIYSRTAYFTTCNADYKIKTYLNSVSNIDNDNFYS